MTIGSKAIAFFAVLPLAIGAPALAETALEKALAEGADKLSADEIAARFAGKTVTFVNAAADKRFLIYYGEGNEAAGKLIGGGWSDKGIYGVTDADQICLSWAKSDAPRLRCMTVVVEDGEVRKYGADGSFNGTITEFQDGRLL